jgi:hypothetical protein
MSMVITFRRIFHPIGQGAFFTEQLLSCPSGKVLFNVVYDCGSKTTGISPKMEKEIKNTFENSHINLLFLSHFDDDHINYVKFLRSKGYLAGAKVLIPLLFEEKFLPVTTFYLNYQNLIDELKGDNIQIIKVKIDEGDSSGREINIDDVLDEEIESGVKLKFVNDKDIWYWVPFNIKYRERIEEFKKGLEGVGIDLDILLKQGEGSLEKINELKSIYQSLTKDKGYGTSINLNSLQMLSYPASPDYCTGYARITECESYFHDYYKWNKGYIKYKFTEKENLYPGSCLYTGDTSSNSPYIWNTLMKKIDCYLKAHLVLFQIPHHGSRHSNDERIVDEDRIYAAFTNFDPDYWQKIYDPNISLQYYLHRKPLILVTNDDSFRFEECWKLFLEDGKV